MASTDSIRVAIVAYEGVSLLDLTRPLEALRVASTHPNHVGSSLIYECSVHSVHGGLVMTADGVGLATEPLNALAGHLIDTLSSSTGFAIGPPTVGASVQSVSGRSSWRRPGS